MRSDRDKDAYDRIVKRFPELFARKGSEPSVGNGWLPIVERLCETVHPFVLQAPKECLCGRAEKDHPVVWSGRTGPNGEPFAKTICAQWAPTTVSFQQIKQKLGYLTVYIDYRTPEITEAIRVASDEADVTCEECGKAGSRVTVAYWIAVLCPECEREARVDREGVKIDVLG